VTQEDDQRRTDHAELMTQLESMRQAMLLVVDALTTNHFDNIDNCPQCSKIRKNAGLPQETKSTGS
jgi:hypothetical protein